MLDKLPLPLIVLASTSPRRKTLLQQVGIDYIVIPPTAEEIDSPEGCAASALLNAERKALSTLEEVGMRPVLGADTVVDVDGEPLGKPKDVEDAASMLRRLSGRRHLVHTGVYLHDPQTDRSYSGVESTAVWFRPLGPLEIDAYIRTGEPLDKAGAYGIQERGALLIDRIEGCFFNVMGLPMARLWGMLKQMMNDRGTPLEGW